MGKASEIPVHAGLSLPLELPASLEACHFGTSWQICNGSRYVSKSMTHKSTSVSCLNVSVSFSFHSLHVCRTAMIFNNGWTEHASSNQLVCVDRMLFLIHICKKFVKSHNVGKIEQCCFLSCKCTIRAFYQLPHSSIIHEVKTESGGSGEGLPVEAGTA